MKTVCGRRGGELEDPQLGPTTLHPNVGCFSNAVFKECRHFHVTLNESRACFLDSRVRTFEWGLEGNSAFCAFANR